MTPKNLALIGAGTIGKMHAKHLMRSIVGARLVAVADVFAKGAEDCATQFDVPRWTTDYTELLNDASIDAVIISSATATHADIVAAAANAHKHIFAEKPIAKTQADGERALSAVQRAGVLFQIGFQRRFDPHFARVHQALANGELGKLHLAHLISRDPGPPTAAPIGLGGGLWFDMMIHDLDMARWLAGCEAVEVYAQADTLIEPALAQYGEVDVAVVTLKMQNGAIITIDNHTDSPYGYDQRAEVVGSVATMRIENVAPHLATLGDKHGFHTSKPLPYFLERYDDIYRQEMQVFVDCLHSGATPPVGVNDARMSLLMALAAKRSHDEQRIVKMSEFA